jgi:microcompartment protein CcmK/EutM
LKLLIVQDIEPDQRPRSSFVVAADAVGAGVGEVVLYAGGSSARQTPITTNRPVDAVIMAIIDRLDIATEGGGAEEAGADESQ